MTQPIADWRAAYGPVTARLHDAQLRLANAAAEMTGGEVTPPVSTLCEPARAVRALVRELEAAPAFPNLTVAVYQRAAWGAYRDAAEAVASRYLLTTDAAAARQVKVCLDGLQRGTSALNLAMAATPQ